MIRIEKESFFKLVPLYDFDFPNRTMLLAALQGEVTGQAFVDDPNTPTASLVVIGFYNFAFIGGKPEQDWLNNTVTQLRTEMPLTIIWAPWSGMGIQSPPGCEESVPRYEFLNHLISQNSEWYAPLLPNGLTFREIDEALLARCQWGGDIIQAYGTANNVLKYGFGVCLMEGSDICCEVYAGFRAEGRYELGVITHEVYRRKGYAALTCQYVAAISDQSGYQTSWSCSHNTPYSKAVALKLGYTQQREYEMWIYPGVLGTE